jgi:methyl-accepting chemotaxis protein
MQTPLQQRYFAGATITVRRKILGLALLIMSLSAVVVLCMRLEVAAYSERDNMRGVNVHVLNAHRFERDFITTRNAEYVQSFRTSLRSIDSITRLYNDAPTSNLRVQLQAYGASFSMLDTILRERGLNENSGAEGAFRASVHAVEKIINEANELQLLNTMLQVRRSEKDFIMRRQDKYIAAVEKGIAKLNEQTEQSRLDATTRQNITTLTAEYTAKFATLVTLFKRVDMLDTRLNNEFLAINAALAIIVEQKERTAVTYRSVSLTVLALAIILSIGLALRVSHNISEPLVVLSKAARQVAQGDFSLTVQTRTRDEIKHLADAFNVMVESIRRGTEELQRSKANVEEKVREAVITIEQDRSYLAHSVERLLEGIERFASGDLTTRFPEREHGEIARVYGGFNHALTKLQDLLLNTHEAVVEAAQVGVIIAEKARSFSLGAQEQSHQATTAAQSVNDMMIGIAGILENINAATLYSKHASDNARKGVQTVEHTASGINAIVVATKTMEQQIQRLTERIDKIDEIAGTIREIADQTNLLSLNASIEAARAGEHGRGFAVVADEVKKLADRTAEATREITATVSGIHKETHGTNAVMSSARETVAKGIEMTHAITYMFEEILNDALQVSDAMAEIQRQSHEQRTTSERVNANVQNITNVVMDSESGIKQLSEVAGELKTSMATVYALLQNFTLSTMQQIDSELHELILKEAREHEQRNKHYTTSTFVEYQQHEALEAKSFLGKKNSFFESRRSSYLPPSSGIPFGFAHAANTHIPNITIKAVREEFEMHIHETDII